MGHSEEVNNCILCLPYVIPVLYRTVLSATGDGSFSIDPKRLGASKSPPPAAKVNVQAIALVGLDGTNISGTGPDMDEIRIEITWDQAIKMSMFTMPERPHSFFLRFEGTTPMDVQMFGKSNATAFINAFVLVDPMKRRPCPACGACNVPQT